MIRGHPAVAGGRRWMVATLVICAGASDPVRAQAPIAFTRVTVIDGTSRTPRPDQTVIVRGNRIVVVGPAATTEVPGTLHRAGVALLPGTDAPLRNSPPGFGLAGELELFVRGGMAPFDALVSATLQPARYFGIADSLGTIEAGKVADLVLLRNNPLAEIGNLRRIEAVVANGRLIDRATREKLLRDLEREGRR